jgi:hypothetical protein
MNTTPTRKKRPRRWPWAILAALLLIPALTVGDTVYLTDGSSLKGRVRAYANDTLVFNSTFGDVKIPRGHITAIVIGDSTWKPPAGAGVGGGAAAAALVAGAAADSGDIVVTFNDSKLSSKIKVRKKKDLEGHLRANTILQVLLVNGDTAWVYADTTMDKTIYQGPDRSYKNTIQLQDAMVRVPVGVHSVSILVYNLGEETYAERFDGKPLHMEYAIGDLRVDKDSERRVNMAISKGKLSMGKPRFVKLD